MGMDVYGRAPKTEVGDYFRNNVWRWRPLAEYIYTAFNDMMGNHPELWFSNDGYGLDADGSKALGEALMRAVDSGETEAYRLRFMAEQADSSQDDYNNLYSFDTENVKEFAEFLKDCGGFQIW